jgi:hypothetical protein
MVILKSVNKIKIGYFLTKIQPVLEVRFSGFRRTLEIDITACSEPILKFSKGKESFVQVLDFI